MKNNFNTKLYELKFSSKLSEMEEMKISAEKSAKSFVINNAGIMDYFNPEAALKLCSFKITLAIFFWIF